MGCQSRGATVPARETDRPKTRRLKAVRRRTSFPSGRAETTGPSLGSRDNWRQSAAWAVAHLALTKQGPAISQVDEALRLLQRRNIAFNAVDPAHVEALKLARSHAEHARYVEARDALLALLESTA